MMVADSDVLIDFLRGRGPLAAQVENQLSKGLLATTTVNVFELESGAQGAAEAANIAQLLDALPILPFTLAAAQTAAKVRRELQSKGLGIGMGDYLIVGICLAERLPLLTRNRKHFERVPELVLVKQEEDPA